MKKTFEPSYYDSMEEFLDHLIDEDKDKPSDSEIILNYGKGLDEINSEMGEFQDNLMFLINKNNIQIKNKAQFILDISSRENKNELMPLIVCFICDNEYIDRLRNRKKRKANNGSLANYILLKQDIDEFINKLSFIKECEKNYKSFVKEIIRDNTKLGEEITAEKIRELLRLYKQYMKNKDRKLPSNENLEYIHKFCTANKSRKSIYPFLIFQIFTRYTKKICNKDLSITSKNLLNSKPYEIEKDNGKNFNAYSNYINLFFELCNIFRDICDINLSIYMFEKTSNLASWYLEYSEEKEPFSYSIDSLVKNSYGSYNSIFFQESNFWRNDFDERGILDEVTKEAISEEEYLWNYLSENLENAHEHGETYLKEMAKGKRYGDIYVKKIAKVLLEFEDENIIQDKEFVNHFYYVLEGFFQHIADEKVKSEIIKFLSDL